MYNWKEKNHYNKYERASSFRIFVELISSLYFCIFFIFFFPYLLVSWFFYFGFSLVLAVGVIGNVLVILVLISYKSMRTSTNLFLLNLRCLSSVHQWAVWISCQLFEFLVLSASLICWSSSSAAQTRWWRCTWEGCVPNCNSFLIFSTSKTSNDYVPGHLGDGGGNV